MRPKKKILLIDADENRRSVRSFVLANRGFAVYAAANAGDARRAAKIASLDVAILVWPFDGAGALLGELHRSYPQMPSMVIGEKLAESDPRVIADAWMLKGGCSQEEINLRAKVMCQRKRGPRPAAERKVPPAIVRAAEFLDIAQRRIV
jgi:DNA-binding response OmpR family regulator